MQPSLHPRAVIRERTLFEIQNVLIPVKPVMNCLVEFLQEPVNLTERSRGFHHTVNVSLGLCSRRVRRREGGREGGRERGRGEIERDREKEREKMYLNTVFLQFTKIVLQESRHNIIHKYLQAKVYRLH